MKNRTSQSAPRTPVLKVRLLIVVLGIVALLFAGPFSAVWKQVYFNKSSITLEKMADSLSSMDRRIGTMRLACERLSASDRIEKFARTNLGLDYPTPDRMVIVRTTKAVTSPDAKNKTESRM